MSPPITPPRAVRLLTRFQAVDEDAALHAAELLRGTAAAVASEHGHLTYDLSAVEGDPTTLYVLETWASADDARRHADVVLDNGAVDRVLPLLPERLDTVTLLQIASHAAGDDPGGEAG
jgi:quinol monooxygenase YgiN